MTGKWEQFNEIREDVPATWYEAAVFVDHAIHHLLNSGRIWGDPEIHALMDAHGRVNDSWQDQEAA